MANEITLTKYGIESIATMHRVWLVDSPEAGRLLEEKGEAAVELSGDLTKWRKDYTLGGWSELDLKKVKVVFALSAMSLTKIHPNLVKAVKDEIEAYAGTVLELVLPKGTTITEFLSSPADDILDRFTPEEDELSEEATVADLAYHLIKEEFDFHYSEEDGQGFLTRKNDPSIVYNLNDSYPSVESWVTIKIKEATKLVPKSRDVADTLKLIAAECAMGDDRVEKMHKRIGRSKTGTVWVDLCRRDGKMVSIKPGSVSIEARQDSDVFFRRGTSKELPLPELVSLEDTKSILMNFVRPGLNISDDEFYLVVGWMISHIIPEHRPPIAMFLGDSGCGKTTATSIIASILEGSGSNGTIAPKKEDDMAVTIAEDRISVWNNMSSISRGLSDNLCQFIDGAAYRKRKLRSDANIVNLTLNPSIILNGITFDDKLAPDLKTRSIIFNLPVLDSSKGINSIDKIVGSVTSNHARILGALFRLAAEVLRLEAEYPHQEGSTRLAEYSRTLSILDDLWGTGGAAFNQYMENIHEMSSTSLDDPVFHGLRRNVVITANKVGDGVYQLIIPTKELLTKLRDPNNLGDAFDMMEAKVTNSASLTKYIKREATDWRAFGFTYETKRYRHNGGDPVSCLVLTFDHSKSQGAWSEPESEQIKYPHID